ncbi:MAG: CPBP family intramembrane metalloprotease, partial [Acidobacteria bacterium]|nr:CPBP family intramembrane metalloprotease [Acidobacteriota bacterium]
MTEQQDSVSPNKSQLPGQRILLGPDGLLRPIWRVALFVLGGGLALSAVSKGLDALVHRFLWLQLETLHFGSNFRYVVINAALLLVTAFFIRVFDRRSFRTLGLWFYAGWAKEAGLGVLCGVGIIAATVGGIVACRGANYAGLAGSFVGWMPQAVFTAMFVLLAAAVEEIAFRGYAFQRLVDSIGQLGAVLVLSALFGAGQID